MITYWMLAGLVVGLCLNGVVMRWPAGPDPRPGQPLPRWALPGAVTFAFGWLALTSDALSSTVVAAGFVSMLVLLAALDITYRIVPNAIVFPALLLALAIGPAGTFASAMAGALIGLIVFGVPAWMGQRLYGRAVLGMGDVKLAMLLGAVVGAADALATLLLAMLLAGAAAAALLGTRRIDRQSTMPYGSFIALAGLIVLLFVSRG